MKKYYSKITALFVSLPLLMLHTRAWAFFSADILADKEKIITHYGKTILHNVPTILLLVLGLFIFSICAIKFFKFTLYALYFLVAIAIVLIVIGNLNPSLHDFISVALSIIIAVAGARLTLFLAKRLFRGKIVTVLLIVCTLEVLFLVFYDTAVSAIRAHGFDHFFNNFF